MSAAFTKTSSHLLYARLPAALLSIIVFQSNPFFPFFFFNFSFRRSCFSITRHPTSILPVCTYYTFIYCNRELTRDRFFIINNIILYYTILYYTTLYYTSHTLRLGHNVKHVKRICVIQVRMCVYIYIYIYIYFTY